MRVGDRPQPAARPDAIADAHLLDGHGAALGADQRSSGDAAVTAAPEAFDVVRGVGPEQLADRSPGELHVVPADPGAQLNPGVVGFEPGGAFDAGFDGVADGGGDDADAVAAADPGVACGSFDMFYDVTCARVRLAGSSAAQQNPEALRGDFARRDLPGVGVPFAALAVAGQGLELRQQLQRFGFGEVTLGELAFDLLDQVAHRCWPLIRGSRSTRCAWTCPPGERGRRRRSTRSREPRCPRSPWRRVCVAARRRSGAARGSCRSAR